jgi:hypothetical protein
MEEMIQQRQLMHWMIPGRDGRITKTKTASVLLLDSFRRSLILTTSIVVNQLYLFL